jgi:hypothetical protein
VLSGVFGPKRDEMIGIWGKLHRRSFITCSLRDNSNDQVKEDEMGSVCSTPGEKRNDYRILFGKRERKEPLGRTRRMWKDNIRMDVEELEC